MVAKWFRRRRWDGVGDTVSIDSTLQQAVQALEYASDYAVKTGNSEDLTGAAHGWMRMTETLNVLSQQAEERASMAEPPKAKPQTGFAAPTAVDETSRTEIAGEEEEWPTE